MDSTTETTSQVLKPTRRRRLTAVDLNEMARLLATRKLTEKEACLKLNINPDQWYQFIRRNNRTVRFEAIITRLRGNYIDGLVDDIEKCGDGVGMKQPDWRAKAWIVENVAPDRFGRQGQQPSAQPTAPATNINVLVVMAQKMLGLTGEGATAAPGKQVSEPVDVKRIEQTTTQPSGEQPLEPLK